MPLEGPFFLLSIACFSPLFATTASERKHVSYVFVLISEHLFTKRLHVIFEMFLGTDSGYVGIKKSSLHFLRWFPAAVSSCYTTNTPIDWFSWFGFGQKAA